MKILRTLVLSCLLIACGVEQDQTSISEESTENGVSIDSLSGLVVAEHFEIVRAQCTACHSAKLITQSSASREGWEQMIRWMQKDQGLPDLGENEGRILDYLSQHYGIRKKGRRTPLTDIDWYVLEP